MNKSLFIIAHHDFRDEEYFITREILEKEGYLITVAGPKKGIAIGVYGGETIIDIALEDVNVQDYSSVIFVGGPGAVKYLDNKLSYEIIQKTVECDTLLAAICISPIILSKAGVLRGKKATVWHSAMDKKPIITIKENGAVYEDSKVVRDGKIITGSGPEAVEEFAQEIIETIRVI